MIGEALKGKFILITIKQHGIQRKKLKNCLSFSVSQLNISNLDLSPQNIIKHMVREDRSLQVWEVCMKKLHWSKLQYS